MIILILFLSLALRIISINQSLWLDEATSALTTRMDLINFFGKFMPGDFHPPLYYLILRFWSRVFGISEVSLRIPSVIFGLLTIYTLYLIGKRLLDEKTGIISALLLGTSGLHIYYSQEARMYSMAAFLATLSIYAFIKSQNDTKKLSRIKNFWWFIFGVTITILGLTDYLSLFILPVFWTSVISTRKQAKNLAISHIGLVFASLLWAPSFINQLKNAVIAIAESPTWFSVLGNLSIKNILLIPLKFSIGRITIDNKIFYLFFAGAILFLYGYLIYKSKKDLKKIKILYLWLTIPISLAILLSVKLPVINYFRFLFVLPAAYLVLSVGINNINKKWKKVVILLVISLNLTTSAIYLFNKKFQREDWRSAVQYIQTHQSPSSIVIFPANSQMEAFRYYLETNPNYSIKIGTFNPNSIRNYSEIWLIRYAQPISDPSDSTRLNIEKQGSIKTDELDFNGVTIWKYNGSIRYANRD